MATTSGTLVSDIKSSYSGPYVHYSCTYTSTRTNAATKTISVALNFKAWLNSSSSKLGTGIGLTVYARIKGSSSWSSKTVKSTSASWSGTTKHAVDTITLTGSSTGTNVTIEFYVARTDNGGNSGKLGTSSNPKSYSAKLPTYSAETYTVTYSVSGDVPSGYTAPTDSTAYASGATVTVKTVPTVSGHTFNGWLKDGAKVTSFAISGNTTLTGVWTQTVVKCWRLNVFGTWKKARRYEKINGTWVEILPRAKVSGMWKKGVS